MTTNHDPAQAQSPGAQAPSVATSQTSRSGSSRWSPTRLLLAPLRSKLFLCALLALCAGGVLMLGSAAKSDDLAVHSNVMHAAPWGVRIGASFIAAFVFAFLVRKVIKAALIVGGLLVGGAFLVHKLGLGVSSEQLHALQEHSELAVRTVQQTADSAWSTLKTYLPSAAAGGVGLWRGARHDA